MVYLLSYRKEGHIDKRWVAEGVKLWRAGSVCFVVVARWRRVGVESASSRRRVAGH